jgi:hypothetical protein
MKEMRVKTPYMHHKEIKGAIGTLLLLFYLQAWS